MSLFISSVAMSFYLWLRNHPSSVRIYSNKRYRRDADQCIANYSDEECIDLFRLDKLGIEFFTDIINEHSLITRKTKAGLPPKAQFLVALRYLATGNSLRSLVNTAGLDLSVGATENCIKNVCFALTSFSSDFIKYSWTPSAVSVIKQGFSQYGNFPGALGAIDGTKIKIKAPSVDENAYVGRHPGHYLNCQVICDHRLKLVDVVAKWPGSVNDSVIWENCGFKRQLEAYFSSMPSSHKAWLIGDSGYASEKYMMVPFAECTNISQERYNKSHKKTRNKVERAIGVLKSRFRCLCKESGGAIQFDEITACNIFIACAMLHNYCIERNFKEIISPDVLQKEQLNQDNSSAHGGIPGGFEARRKVVEQYFSS